MRLVSEGDSTPMPLIRRLREEDLTSNLCWLLVCSRTNFPVPVTRTRLAVPLWVFIFGMSLVLFVWMSLPAAARSCCAAPAVCGGAVDRGDRSGLRGLLVVRRLG